MSNQYGGPWTNQPSESGAPGPQPGWAQPGPPGPPSPYAPVQPGFGAQPEHPPGPAGYGWQAPYPVGYAMPLRTDYASWGKRVGAMLIDHIPSYVGMIIFTVGYVYWLISIVQSSGSTVDLTGGAIPMMIGTLV